MKLWLPRRALHQYQIMLENEPFSVDLRLPSCLLQLHLSDSLTNKVSDSQVTANFLGPWNDSFQYVLLKNVKYD